MNIKTLKYKITWDKVERKNDSKTPKSLEPILVEIYEDIQSGKNITIPRLRKLTKKYPSNPQLKNYLSTAHEMRGDLVQAKQVNDANLEQNPDYFFARLKKAGFLYDEGYFEQIPKIINEEFDLQVMYPDRDVFHISEFENMQLLAIQYYIATGDLDQAEKRLNLMKEIAPDTEHYAKADNIYSVAILQAALERKAEEDRQGITTKNKFHLRKKTFERPDFNFPTTEALYQYDTDIPDKVIQRFYEHDRNQVIEDLENVLKDSYFNYSSTRNHQEEPFAAIHALFLLGDLQSEKSLPVVLEMMQQDEEYMEDVFGDLFTEAGWISLVKIGKNQLDALLEYLKLPGTYCFFKSGVSDALEQIWYHFPEKRAEIETLFGELLDYLHDSTPEENVVDTLFNGLLISNILDLNLKQFIPQIEKMYKKDYVDFSICGSFDEVKRKMASETQPFSWKRDLQNIKEIYDSFTAPIKPLPEVQPPQQNNQPVIHTSKKVGRNDPCPCGSGKKYKKCCLRKT